MNLHFYKNKFSVSWNRNTYSYIALFLLFFSELAAIFGLFYHYCNVLFIVAFILFLLIILTGFLGSYWGKYKFGLHSTIFTKLMANAIAPSRLGSLYLLYFIIHLGWLTNGSYDLYKLDNQDTTDVWVSLFVGTIGLILLICFFPNGKVDKTKAKKIVFISGMSKLSMKEIELKNETKSEIVKLISLYNQIPLANFFQLLFKYKKYEQNDFSKMLILGTKAHYEENVFKKSAIDITKLINDKIISINSNDSFLDNNRIKRYNGTYVYYVSPFYNDESKKENKNDIDNIIKTIIKITLLQEFSDHKEFIKNLTIEPTPACDYDNFEQCFETLHNAIKKEDNNEQRLFFNLTPGTGIVGSLMTLFSIDKDRELFFYAQNSSKALKPVDKSRLPLENLLSQALEKIKEME